jgi:DNA-binding SARP family transcriptional activator/tetratricopeptide (TPR) repeat protein
MAGTATDSRVVLRAAPLRVQLLGPFGLSLREARAGPWPRPSARRLCELLLVTPGHRLGRSAACDVLFSNLGADAAGNALRKALSMTKVVLSAMGDDAALWLRADRGSIWLEPSFEVEVDFEAHREALRAALSAPSGPERDRRLSAALTEEGVLLADEPYADWAFGPREALEALRHEARLALARDRARGLGRCGQADVIEAWEACSRSDPASEEAACVLVGVYSAQGRHALAAATYQRCRHALEELGLQTSPALEKLARSPSEPAQRPAYRPVAAGEESRVVSVLAVGLSGGTAPGGRLGPEELHDVVAAALADVLAQVERLGGTVTAVSGAGVVAVFGAPEAHEDDPERALRAALRSLRSVAAYGDCLTLRIGVETGEAVVGPMWPGLGGHYGAVGEVSLVAAALQSLATPASVLVGPTTRRATQGIFEWGTTEEFSVSPGDKSIRASYLERLKVRPAGEVARRRLAGAAPLFGRELELSVLRRALEQTIDGNGGVVVIRAEAGLGKTRLVQECRKMFMTWAGAAPERLPLWVEGRARPYESNTPYGLFQQLLYSWVGAPREGSDDVGLAALERAVKATFAGDAARHRVALLAHVMGVGVARLAGASPELARLGAEALQRACFSAVQDLFIRLMAHGPTVLVLEDLHWADATSLRLAEALCPLAKTGPLLVILTRRPEPDPGVTALETALVVSNLCQKLCKLELYPLAKEPSEALVRALLGEGIRDEVVTPVAEGAEGNPLFLEERLASLMETRALVRTDGGGWRLDIGAPGQVPEALERLVRSRVDRLEPLARDVITAASVLGDDFSLSALANVTDLGERLNSAVLELTESGLVVEVGVSADKAYRFRHSLIQQAIYKGLLRHQRRRLHARAAWGLETLSAGRLEEAAALLGHHFALAGEVERAHHYLDVAGDHAASVFANDEAVTLYRRALEVLGTASRGDLVLEAVQQWLKLGALLWRLGRYDEGRAALQQAAQVVPPEASLLAARCYRWLGQLEIEDCRDAAAAAALDTADALLQGLEDVDQDAWAETWLDVQLSRSNLHYWRSETQSQAAVLARMRPVVAARGSARQKGDFQVHVTGQRWRANRFVVSAEMISEVRSARSAVARAGEDPENFHWQTLGFLLLLHGDVGQAETELHGALGAARRAGDKSLELFCLIFLGWAHLRRHDVVATKQLASESLQLVHDFPSSAMARALLCWVAWKEGALVEAERLGVQALEQWEPLVVRYPFCWICLLPLIAVRLAGGRHQEALASARRLVEPIQMRLPAQLESAVAAALSASESGRPATAAERLRQALGIAEQLNFL